MHLFDAPGASTAATPSSAAGCRSPSAWPSPTAAQATRRVTACFFGEGAVAEGEFHETMNLAALWRLPVLFCCENNLYAMGTARRTSEAVTDLALRAASLRHGGLARRRGAAVGPCGQATRTAAPSTRSAARSARAWSAAARG